MPRSQPEPDHDVPRPHQGSSTSPTGPTTDYAMPAFHPPSNHPGNMPIGHCLDPELALDNHNPHPHRAGATAAARCSLERR